MSTLPFPLLVLIVSAALSRDSASATLPFPLCTATAVGGREKPATTEASPELTPIESARNELLSALEEG